EIPWTAEIRARGNFAVAYTRPVNGSILWFYHISKIQDPLLKPIGVTKAAVRRRVERRRASRDFAVMLPGLYDRLTRMVIDEDGDPSVGIVVVIEFDGRRENERGGNECKGFVTERDIDQIAERLEVTPEAEYERIMGRVRQELKKKRLRVGKRQKYSLKQ
ncbi:hypothetical protein HPB47_002163, partial [Ixodes persulcatus]